jgi:hypothetical protein
MAYEKHVGIYETNDKFKEEATNGTLVAPWVAYVKKGNSYDVFYSNEMTLGGNGLNVAEVLIERINNLENRMISLTEDEYETLIELPEGETMVVTSPDGTTKEISYDPTVYYCTYDPEE